MYAYCSGQCGRVLNCPNEPAIYACGRCWSALVTTLYRVCEKAPTDIQPYTGRLIKTFYKTVKTAPLAQGKVFTVQRTTEAIQ
jgi:hypothetical protein